MSEARQCAIDTGRVQFAAFGSNKALAVKWVGMRVRAICAAILSAAFLFQAVPCHAHPAGHNQSRHECCGDDSMCPDRLAAAPHSGHDTAPMPCCLAGESRHQQSQTPVQAKTTIILPAPQAPGPFIAPALAPDQYRSSTALPRARSAPLHLLFSVYLI